MRNEGTNMKMYMYVNAYMYMHDPGSNDMQQNNENLDMSYSRAVRDSDSASRHEGGALCTHHLPASSRVS